jgi:hypothetical protein
MSWTLVGINLNASVGFKDGEISLKVQKKPQTGAF